MFQQRVTKDAKNEKGYEKKNPRERVAGGAAEKGI